MSPPLLSIVPSSDFIATAKIVKITPDKKDSHYHDIQIQIIDLYKGEPIKNLKLHSQLMSRCSLYTPENSEWLIFAHKNEEGNLRFGYCSGSKRLDRKFDKKQYPYTEESYKKGIALKLQMLSYLKNEGIQPKNKYEVRVLSPSDCLESFRGLEVKGDYFAVYELTIEKDLSSSEVKPIKKFGNDQIQADLINCLRNGITIEPGGNKTEIPTPTKLIIGLYYYPPERGNKSFISMYDL